MNLHHVYYLDTSAIVKLSLREEGTEILGKFLQNEYSSSTFYATSFCFGEALGVLKSKYFNHSRIDHIDEETYFAAAELLSAYVNKDGEIELRDVDISKTQIFDEVEKIARRNKIDIVDAYQIVIIKTDLSSRTDLKSEPILITADSDLARAARKEGFRAWDCLNELPPY